jgi:hypothetical protein
MLLANGRLRAAAARTKAYPGSAAYRFQLRHSVLDPVMVGLALTTVFTTMWAVFGKLLFSVETQNWLVYAPFVDRVAYRGISNSALVAGAGVSGSSPLLGSPSLSKFATKSWRTVTACRGYQRRIYVGGIGGDRGPRGHASSVLRRAMAERLGGR